MPFALRFAHARLNGTLIKMGLTSKTLGRILTKICAPSTISVGIIPF